MKIHNIQSYNYKPTFGLKFKKKDIKEFIDLASWGQDDDKSTYPKLYTMLKYFEEFPGDVAYLEYVTRKNPNESMRVVKNWNEKHRILEDEEFLGIRIYAYTDKYNPKEKVYYGYDYENALPEEALRDATVTSTDEHYRNVHMPERIFEQEWFKNRNKTADDIRKLAIDA